MCGTIVAVHAVHSSALTGRQFLTRGSIDDILAHHTVAIPELHIRDVLAVGVGGDVLDLVVQIHVPMDASADAEPGAPPTHI